MRMIKEIELASVTGGSYVPPPDLPDAGDTPIVDVPVWHTDPVLPQRLEVPPNYGQQIM